MVYSFRTAIHHEEQECSDGVQSQLRCRALDVRCNLHFHGEQHGSESATDPAPITAGDGDYVHSSLGKAQKNHRVGLPMPCYTCAALGGQRLVPDSDSRLRLSLTLPVELAAQLPMIAKRRGQSACPTTMGIHVAVCVVEALRLAFTLADVKAMAGIRLHRHRPFRHGAARLGNISPSFRWVSSRRYPRVLHSQLAEECLKKDAGTDKQLQCTSQVRHGSIHCKMLQ
mmetsp:Transcript_2837/g.5367  ORF Transcript_2837/g.5367 Transcript_2837/m.5367 type:complete len:227 (-) Transcript_2837:28-708(-)